VRKIDPDMDSEHFNIPTLYTTDHIIQQSEDQLTSLRLRIAGARGYVAMMKHTRDMNMPEPTAKRLSLRDRLVRDYYSIVEGGYTVAFYIAIAFCALILLVGVYSWVRD